MSDLKIFVQPTPNPSSFKFATNKVIKSGEHLILKREDITEKFSRLIQDIFLIPEVTSLHLFANTVTVSFEESDEKYDASIDKVKAVVETRLDTHNPDFAITTEKVKKNEDRSTKNPEIQKIEEILDRTVRTGLNADGGGIDVVSFENNELKIRYEGACESCPQAFYGTLQAIQDILSYELKNEDLKVTPLV